MCKLNIEEIDTFKEIWGGKSALSIKPAFGIGKVLFHFFNRDSKEKVDCYMNVEDFVGKLLEVIRTGELLRDIKGEKAKGEQYPKEVWKSPYGGDKNATPPISRSFTIAPGAKQSETGKTNIVFTAYAYPGEVTDDGKICPKKGSKPTSIIRVPADFNELRTLRIVAEGACMEYISRKYSINNIKEYHDDVQNQQMSKPQTTKQTPAQPQQQKESDVPRTAKFTAAYTVTAPINKGTGSCSDYYYLSATNRTNVESTRLWLKNVDMDRNRKRWTDFETALAGGTLEATFVVEEVKGKFRILDFA